LKKLVDFCARGAILFSLHRDFPGYAINIKKVFFNQFLNGKLRKPVPVLLEFRLINDNTKVVLFVLKKLH
jgi:hypothetical protein